MLNMNAAVAEFLKDTIIIKIKASKLYIGN